MPPARGGMGTRAPADKVEGMDELTERLEELHRRIDDLMVRL